MDIHNDKFLYKVIALVFFVFSLIVISIAFVSGGLKGALFACWIVFSFTLFLGILIFSLFQKGLQSSSPQISKRIAWGFIDFHVFRFLAVILAILFGVLTFGVWEYLDQKLPTLSDENIPVSQIPSPMDKK